jgi:SAM-dependent methyltransferase
MTTIEYHALPGPRDWLVDLKSLVQRTGASRIADLGAGAHPVLDAEYVKSAGLDYTIIDISESELEKAGTSYKKVIGDVTKEGFARGGRFDLVHSRWLLEHISNPRQFHRNVLEMLEPGGRAVHFFPTLYSLPFVLNWALPEAVSSRLLGTSFAGRSKFPARYRWCRGPTRRQIGRFMTAGFEVEEYVGYYGHPYYQRLRPLDAAEHPLPGLTSFASVTLVKPPLHGSSSDVV